MAQPTSNDLKTIANLYVALFNRAPDKAGLNFWATALANGASLNTIGQGFLSAPEGVATYPAAQSGEAFIRAFYQTTFGRPADQGGLAFWQELLSSAGGANSSAARAFVVTKITELVSKPLSGSGATDTQSIQDRALFANKIEYGLFLATQTTLTGSSATAQTLSLSKVTADAASVASLKAAALLVQNPVVTPVADKPVNLVMTLAQLNEKGAIGGNSNVDSLTLTVNGNVSATPANVKGIEKIYVKMDDPGTFTVDAARFKGAKMIVADRSDKLIFNNLNAAQTGWVLETVNPKGSTSFNFAPDVARGTVEITGLGGGNVVIGGVGLTHATIKSNLFDNIVSNIGLSSTVTKLTIEADANLTIPSSEKVGLIAGGANDLSIVITGKGKGKVKLNAELESVNPNIHSLDASASTGGVEARLVGSADFATKIVGSAVRDVIRMTGGKAELNAKSIIDLGDGDDHFAGGVGKINAGAVIDGGEGYDTLSAFSLRGRTTLDDVAAFKNFEQVAVSGTGEAISADLALISNTNSIDRLVLSGGTGGVTVNNVATKQALYVYGQALNTTTINLAAPAGEYSINFATGFASSASQVVDAGTIAINAENLTLNSGGLSSNKITIADTSLKSLNVTGDKDIEVRFDSVANTSINLKGDIGAATGKLSLIGTAAADTFTFNRAATVTGGEGKDVYKLSGTAIVDVAQVKAKMVSITDFGTGDQISVGVIAKGSTGTSLFKHESSALTLSEAAQAAVVAAAAQSTAAQEFATFLFNKITYVVADIDSPGAFGAGDVLVELVGQANLGNAVVDVALGTLTIGSPIP